MELKRGTTRIYACPICKVNTPHTVAGCRGNTYGIKCAHCQSGSLVDGDLLDAYQARWEDELRELLQGLGDVDEE